MTIPDMVCPRCWSQGHDPASPANPCAYCNGKGRASDTLLSPHFALSEMLASQTAVRRGIPNDPSLAVIRSLTDLCVNVWEPLRVACGPIHIDSGYRSQTLNIAVGGAVNSGHTTGDCGDGIPLGCSKRQLFDAVLALKLPFDQRIWEFSSWIHVGHRGPGGCQRRESLMIFAGSGYKTFDPSDPRVA